MKTTVSLLLTLCLLPVINFGATNPTLGPPVTTASPQYLDKIAAFEEFVRQQMQKDKIPGLTIGFFKDEDGWANGFGYADLENKIPARADSAYRLASITKTFTGAAILQLVEKGKMSLDGGGKNC